MSTRKLSGLCHTDVPHQADDTGEILRQRANESCGAHVVGRDLFQVADEIHSLGGAGKQLDRIINRTRGDK